MNTSNNNELDIKSIQSAFKEILRSSSDADKLEMEQDMLQLDILEYISSELKKKGIKRSELPSMLNVTKSFISQLFSADKRLNLEHLAKFQRILDEKFMVTMKNDINKSHSIVIVKLNQKSNRVNAELDYDYINRQPTNVESTFVKN